MLFTVRISLQFGLGCDYGEMSCAYCRYLYKSDEILTERGYWSFDHHGQNKECLSGMYEGSSCYKMYR